MSITVTGVTASPTTVAPGGGQSIITPALLDPDRTATVTVSSDGSTGTAAVLLHESEVYSVDPADIGVQGKVVATVDQGGTLAVGPNSTFVFTAS